MLREEDPSVLGQEDLPKLREADLLIQGKDGFLILGERENDSDDIG